MYTLDMVSIAIHRRTEIGKFYTIEVVRDGAPRKFRVEPGILGIGFVEEVSAKD